MHQDLKFGWKGWTSHNISQMILFISVMWEIYSLQALFSACTSRKLKSPDNGKDISSCQTHRNHPKPWASPPPLAKQELKRLVVHLGTFDGIILEESCCQVAFTRPLTSSIRWSCLSSSRCCCWSDLNCNAILSCKPLVRGQLVLISKLQWYGSEMRCECTRVTFTIPAGKYNILCMI